MLRAMTRRHTSRSKHRDSSLIWRNLRVRSRIECEICGLVRCRTLFRSSLSAGSGVWRRWNSARGRAYNAEACSCHRVCSSEGRISRTSARS
jgi:hypothetical protein